MLHHVFRLPFVLLLILALCFVPPVFADAPTGGSSKTASVPSSASSSSPPPTRDDREARASRKSSRIDAGKRRMELQERRVHEKASKSGKKYSAARQKRLSSLLQKQQRAAKAAQKSEAYWQNKRESVTPAALRKGEKKLSSLLTLAAAQGATEAIRVKGSAFTDLIATSPRPYWVLLSLTALSGSYDCKVCGVAHASFGAVAPSVHALTLARANASATGETGAFSSVNVLLAFNATTSAAERERLQREHDDEVKKSLPVFVVEADIDDNRNAFNTMQITSAPTILLLPPSFSPKPPSLTSFLPSVAGKYRFIPQSLDLSASTWTTFLNGHVEPKVELAAGPGAIGWVELGTNRLQSFNPVILAYFAVIAAGLLAFLVAALYRAYCARGAEPFSLISFFLPTTSTATYAVTASSIASLNFAQPWLLLPRLPLILSAIAFYLFCVSGGLFTVIKESDFGFDYTASGALRYSNWISNQYMDQTVAESTVLAGLYCALFALIVVMNSRTFHMRRGEGWTASRALGWAVSWAASPVGLLALIALVYLQLINVYGKKNNYHWGMNWKWLNAVQWNRLIPYPQFHRYVDQLWKMIMRRMW